jgi:hypothetical protein
MHHVSSFPRLTFAKNLGADEANMSMHIGVWDAAAFDPYLRQRLLDAAGIVGFCRLPPRAELNVADMDDLFLHTVIDRLDVLELNSCVPMAFQAQRPPRRARCTSCLGQSFWTERSGHAHG